MKCLIFYTFNYYESNKCELDMLKLSLYSVYHVLVTTGLFDVIIYTETDDILRKELDFPCQIIHLNRQNNQYGSNKYPETDTFIKCNEKFLFIGQVRMLLLQKLLIENNYDKYIYLDNDTFILRGHSSDVIDGLIDIHCMGYLIEGMSINYFINFQIEGVLNYCKSNQHNKYLPYYNHCSINDGIIILDSSALAFVDRVVEIFLDLIGIYSWLWSHDQTAFSIAYHMHYPKSTPVIVNSPVKYFYHYVSEKHRFGEIVGNTLAQICTFPLNHRIKYNYLDDNFACSAMDSAEVKIRSLFDNVIHHRCHMMPKIVHIVRKCRDDECDSKIPDNWKVMKWYLDEINEFYHDNFKREYNFNFDNVQNRLLIWGCNVLYKYGGIFMNNPVYNESFEHLSSLQFVAVTDRDNNISKDFIASCPQNANLFKMIRVDWSKRTNLRRKILPDDVVKIYPITRFVRI
jgi:hypothetical protein